MEFGATRAPAADQGFCLVDAGLSAELLEEASACILRVRLADLPQSERVPTRNPQTEILL